MVGVINYKKLEQDFLNDVYQKAEQSYYICIQDINNQKEYVLQYLKNTWSKCLIRLGDKYQELCDSGLTGTLCYGYLSFLRSGIINQTNWFRMDYYDSRDRISQIECGDRLEIISILKTFNNCTNEIRSIFKAQTLVKEYKADKIIIQMAEQFCVELRPLLLDAFYQVLEEEGSDLYDKLTLKFFMGELFSQAEAVFVWSDSTIYRLKDATSY